MGVERTLLHGIFRRTPARRLSELRHALYAQQAVRKASRQLLHEAVFSEALSPSVPTEPADARDSEPGGDDDTVGMLSRVRAFRDYLDGLRPGDASQRGAFSDYLPYAVALGFGEEWARQGAILEHASDGYPWYGRLPTLTRALTVYAGSVMPTGRHLGDDEPYGPSDALDGESLESPFRGYRDLEWPAD